MRKIFLISLLTIFLVINLKPANAQETSGSQSAEAISPTPVEYQLPYPGLLPDNSLYFLKTLRDRVIGFLISDPIKKSEFYLLSADKRLSAGTYTFNKGKFDLAETTISKGENYFEASISEVSTAKKQGRETTEISKKLLKAFIKHKEVLTSLFEKAPKDKKEKYGSLMKRVDNLEKKVNTLIKK